jgi:hypothetical protein
MGTIPHGSTSCTIASRRFRTLKSFRFLIVLGSLVFCPTAAWAVPAPLSPAELIAASDLVALVRVLAVTCIGVWRYGETGEDLGSYRARLLILQVTKGPVRKGASVSVTWKEIPRGFLGPWVVRYFPGEELWTHLQYNRDGPGYVSTWWNARGEQVRPPDTTLLPGTPGQVIRARGWLRFALPRVFVSCMGRLSRRWSR